VPVYAQLSPQKDGQAEMIWAGWLHELVHMSGDVHPSKYYPGTVLTNYTETNQDQCVNHYSDWLLIITVLFML